MRSLIYTVFASFCTFIISNLISLILHENVILKEAIEIKTLLKKAITKEFNFKDDYILKIKNAYLKLKTIALITSRHRFKLNNYNKNHVDLPLNKDFVFKSKFEIKNENNEYVKKFNLEENIIKMNEKILKCKNEEKNNYLNSTIFDIKNSSIIELKTKKLKKRKLVMLTDKQNIYDKSEYLLFSDYNIKNIIKFSPILKEKNLVINQIEFEILKNKIIKLTKNKFFQIQDRKFIFPNFQSEKISCFQLCIVDLPVFNKVTNFLRKKIKITILAIVFLYLWLYFILFMQSIYKQYGNNIIKICILPLISMLVVKFLITFNIMIFISTLLLQKWGRYFLSNNKIPKIIRILFNIFVPPLAQNHYSAIMLFLQLLK